MQERGDYFYSYGMELSDVEARLGYEFRDSSLLLLAFTHRSYFNENQDEVGGHNERLEFLGDSVLGLVVSSYLYTHLPSQSEGHLSHLRAHLVGAESCSKYLYQLGVEDFFRLGKGESANVGRGRERIIADLFEAVVGAIFLDGGIEKAEAFLLTHFSEAFNEAMETPLRNWKADLQDYSQKKFQKPPQYVVIEESGPPHQRTFVVAAEIEEVEVGRGSGSSKKEAEQEAAEDALRSIEKNGRLES